MSQAINPYAPTTTDDSLPSSQQPEVDPAVGTVTFASDVDEASWHRIRRCPPPPSLFWIVGTAAMIVCGSIIAFVWLMNLSSRPTNPHVPFIMAAIFIGLIGAILLTIYFDMRRIGESPRQTQVQPWYRGRIEGELTQDHLIVHSTTVSLLIPQQRIRKVQWYAGALQVYCLPWSVPPEPQLRFSIPAEGFQDGERTVIPIQTRRKRDNRNSIPISDDQWQQLIDQLLKTIPGSEAAGAQSIPLSDHLRWNDLEWMKHREVIRRIFQFVVLFSLGVYGYFWLRTANLPATWQPKADEVTSTGFWGIVPLAIMMVYLARYHLPLFSRRKILPIQGSIRLAEQNSGGPSRLVCLRSPGMVVAYRGKPTEYGRWTEHGLEFRPRPKRMLFFIPARLFDGQQRETLARCFAESAQPPNDLPAEQHWEGPTMTITGSVPDQQSEASGTKQFRVSIDTE